MDSLKELRGVKIVAISRCALPRGATPKLAPYSVRGKIQIFCQFGFRQQFARFMQSASTCANASEIHYILNLKWAGCTGSIVEGMDLECCSTGPAH
jgi:hypothetical protein